MIAQQKDQRMYGQLSLHLQHLHRHYKSGGTVPLKGMNAVLPDISEDQARLKAALGKMYAVADCPSMQFLNPMNPDWIKRKVLIRWHSPWHVAEVVAKASNDAQPMMYKDAEVQPTHLVYYLKDRTQGEAYLTADSYYVEGARSVLGTWALLEDKPLESAVDPTDVRDPQSKRKQAGTTGRIRNKRLAPEHGPTSHGAKKPRNGGRDKPKKSGANNK